jgi:3',5'-cyclic AMP phosphodiesterase CpdA
VLDQMPRPVTLFHVSDLHFGAEDRAALAWFAQSVADVRPDAVICTGDLTMRARRREFSAAAAWLGALAAPVMVEPGNHDMPYFNLIERFFTPYARYRQLRRAVNRDLELDQVAVIPLQTIAPAQWRLNWSKGHVGGTNLAHALAGLSAAASAGIRLAACHHPLIEADTQATASTRGGSAALAALARCGADAVLSGHVHDAFDRMVYAGGMPIRLIGAGTLSQRLRTTRPSFNRLDYSLAQGLQVSPQLMPG